MLTTEDLVSMFTTIAEDMDNPHWRMGDELVDLRQQGYKKQQLEEVCERVFSIGRSAVNNHYRTSLIFNPDQRALEINWALHERCGRAVKDVRKIADYAKARDWLTKVQGGTYTYTSLVDAMKGNGDDEHKPDPVYLCKRVPARVVGGHLEGDEVVISLAFDRSYDFEIIDTEVLLTMFIPAQVHTSEQLEGAA